MDSILLTTESLNTIKACTGSYSYITGSVFGVSGSLQYVTGSQSESSAFFQKYLIYPFTCSNSTEVRWLMWGAEQIGMTGSIYNQEHDLSITYHRIIPPVK